jgi:hypothetical protein
LLVDDDDVGPPPEEIEPEPLPPGAIVFEFKPRPIIFKQPTRRHGDNGVIWRPPPGGDAATFAMPEAAKRTRRSTS